MGESTRDLPERGPAHPLSKGWKRPRRTGGGGRILRNPTPQPLAAAKAERAAGRPASPGDGTGEGWGPQPGLRRELLGGEGGAETRRVTPSKSGEDG